MINCQLTIVAIDTQIFINISQYCKIYAMTLGFGFLLQSIGLTYFEFLHDESQAPHQALIASIDHLLIDRGTFTAIISPGLLAIVSIDQWLRSFSKLFLFRYLQSHMFLPIVKVLNKQS